MNLLITGAFPKDEAFFAELRSRGHTVSYLPDERAPLKAQDIDPAAFDGVICNALFLHTPVERFSRLRFVQLTSAGLDRVPLDVCEQRGIAVYNAKGVYSVPMAEFVLAGVLQLYKHLPFFSNHQKKRQWVKHRGLLELQDKNVCIIGCGSVGTACAARFRAFGCRVTGVDCCDVAADCFDEVLGLEHLDAALRTADVVLVSIALTADTFHLLDHRRLALLKSGAVLVNVSRGGIVDTEALVSVLPQLGGAVLDVFEEEPLPQDSPLWGFEHVIITPHNAFIGENNRARLKQCIVNTLCEENRKNPEAESE